MKNWFKKYTPSTHYIKNSKATTGWKSYFKDRCFWSRSQQAIARGVAAGLAGAVIPGFQIFYAAILVILLRGNLPVALVATLITNPLTVIPIAYGTYLVGAFIIGNGNGDFVIKDYQWDFTSVQAFWSNSSEWLLQFGQAYFVGLPIVSLALGIIGYFGTIFIWEASLLLFRKRKK
jgi:uncharacterized protein (DUF2062 family)